MSVQDTGYHLNADVPVGDRHLVVVIPDARNGY